MAMTIQITNVHPREGKEAVLEVTSYPEGMLAGSPQYGRVIRKEVLEPGVTTDVSIYGNTFFQVYEQCTEPDLDL
jgi:hypothetical protein